MNRVTTFFLRAALPLLLTGSALLRADTLPPAGASSPVPAASETNRTPLTREILHSSLSQAIGSHFNLEGDLQVELIRPWSPPERVAAAWSISVLDFPSVAASSMMLRCKVLADGASVAETTFVVKAQLWRDAWVTRQPLTIGAAFDASMLEARRVDLFRDRDALPAAVGDRSYIFARGVAAGRLLTWRDISRRPLVRKGDTVEVTAIDGLLAVTMKGVAMQNGAQGDTVTVRNPESRKDFAAMVIDENRVQVRF